MGSCIGIFWVIEGEVYASKEILTKKRILEDKRGAMTGIIDSNFSHFEEWEKGLQTKYPQADFAVYPRGRVVYSLQEQTFILFLDECITNAQVRKIVTLFGLSAYRIDYDEHYTCDGCIEEKGIF